MRDTAFGTSERNVSYFCCQFGACRRLLLRLLLVLGLANSDRFRVAGMDLDSRVHGAERQPAARPVNPSEGYRA